MLATPQYANTLNPLASSAGCALRVLQGSSSNKPDELAQQQFEDTASRLEDSQGALMLFTSGTTGRPKGKLGFTAAHIRQFPVHALRIVSACDGLQDDLCQQPTHFEVRVSRAFCSLIPSMCMPVWGSAAALWVSAICPRPLVTAIPNIHVPCAHPCRYKHCIIHRA